MTIEQTFQNIFTHIKVHYSENIPLKIRKLEKNMIKYSSYTSHLRLSLCCHPNKILPKDNFTPRWQTGAGKADKYHSCYT